MLSLISSLSFVYYLKQTIMKRIILFAMAALCSVAVHAQYASSIVTPGNTITARAVGYVVKRDGTRLEGEIQLKVVDYDTLEIRFFDVNKNKQI